VTERLIGKWRYSSTHF